MTTKPAESRLSQILHRGQIDDDQVAEMVDAIHAVGIEKLPHRVFPKGIPYPDGVEVDVVLKPNQFDVIRELLSIGRIEKLEVFPYGIINPELFRARVEMR